MIRILTVLSLAATTLAAWSQDNLAPAKGAGVGFAAAIEPLLATYCYDCHDGETKKAGFDLEGLASQPDFIRDRDDWSKVLRVIVEREMPPEKKAQPEEDQRLQIANSISSELDKFDCSSMASPGRVTARRLNRTEYRNTIRDLTGVDFDPTTEFPNDEVGYGFDNNGDVLSLPPMLMEKYLNAAESIASAMILTELPPWPPSTRLEGEAMEPKPDDENEGAIRPFNRTLGLYREGYGEASLTIEEEGEYEIQIRAFGDQAGPEAPRLSYRRNGQEIRQFSIDASAAKPKIYRFKERLQKGNHKVEFGYLNNFNSLNHPNPKLRGDRNLFIDYVDYVGPLGQPRPPLPAPHRSLIPEPAEPGNERQTAATYLTRFAAKAYRRPITQDEAERLETLASNVLLAGAAFEEAMQIGVQAILCSPHFLYRWELNPIEEEESQPRALTEYELASRLSYFLWSSLPDDRLLALAANKTLLQPAVLEAEIHRMLNDPKSAALVESFAGQWLQIRNLKDAEPDDEQFPAFSEALRQSMKRETELFFSEIIREDRSLLDLLVGDFTYLNAPLAKLYGQPEPSNPGFQRVTLSPTSGRLGVLTQASILTITSNPNRTSPVNRGKWILEQILGSPPPPPPPNVPEIEEEHGNGVIMTLRQKMEQHRNNPDCSTCHDKMDPIGFAFENFDAIGAWRAKDGGAPIDASGVLPTGETFSGARGLIDILRKDERFIRTISEKMLIFALGRGLEYYDKCAIDQIVDLVNANEQRFSSLILAIVQSAPFNQKTVSKTES